MGLDINSIPPELLRELIGSGPEVGNTQDDIARQMAQAQLMRSMGGNATDNGQGRTVRNGIYVAGSPLSAIAGAAGSVGGAMKDIGVANSQKQLRTLQGSQFEKVLEALIKQDALKRAGVAASPTPPQSPMQVGDMNNPAAMGMYP